MTTADRTSRRRTVAANRRTVAPSRRPRRSAWRTRLYGLTSDLFAVLGPAGVEAAGLVEPTIGVRAEIVAQALQQVRRAARARRDRRNRRATRRRLASARPCSTASATTRAPGRLGLDDGVAKVALAAPDCRSSRRRHRLRDAVEEAGANDAAAAPQRSDLAEFQVSSRILRTLRVSCSNPWA